jgi:putative ABC transport system ATP-binding protein
MGKSGSGKTTLLNCMGGLEAPERGRVLYDGRDIYQLSARQLSHFQRHQLGFVFQRGNLLSYLTVAENIGFPLTLNGKAGDERAKRIDELLDRIGLTGAGSALPHELSAGEMQRVAIARAVAHSPQLLLADEPTANLDTATGRQIVALMHGLGREYDCTVIMATHDTEITQKAEEIIRLKDGRLAGE